MDEIIWIQTDKSKRPVCNRLTQMLIWNNLNTYYWKTETMLKHPIIRWCLNTHNKRIVSMTGGASKKKKNIFSKPLPGKTAANAGERHFFSVCVQCGRSNTALWGLLNVFLTDRVRTIVQSADVLSSLLHDFSLPIKFREEVWIGFGLTEERRVNQSQWTLLDAGDPTLRLEAVTFISLWNSFPTDVMQPSRRRCPASQLLASAMCFGSTKMYGLAPPKDFITNAVSLARHTNKHTHTADKCYHARLCW